MRNLEDIERDLAEAREALSSVEGTPAEVYSRIVGYYRSVRNWNKGKREEYGERRLYLVKNEELAALSRPVAAQGENVSEGPVEAPSAKETPPATDVRLLLFVRASCPACPPAKTAAGRLGIPVDMINADTADGIAEAMRLNVLSTPTAILLSQAGKELGRAKDAETISRLLAIAV